MAWYSIFFYVSRKAADSPDQSFMMSSGMTQDMGDLDVVSEDEGEGLTDQEAEEGARAYDNAQVHPIPHPPHQIPHRTALCFPMLSCVSYVRAGSCVFGGFGCGGDGHCR